MTNRRLETAQAPIFLAYLGECLRRQAARYAHLPEQSDMSLQATVARLDALEELLALVYEGAEPGTLAPRIDYQQFLNRLRRPLAQVVAFPAPPGGAA